MKSQADAALFQETRETSPEKCRKLEKGAWIRGWAASISTATKTLAGGASAGVAVLARKGTGMTTDNGLAVGPTHAERLHHAWMGGVQRGGIHIVSIYLWTGEGLSERNLALLHRLKLVLRALKGPWVVGGDWNIEPELLQSSGWARFLRGQLFVPKGPTCGDRRYDYFLTSTSLAHAVAGAQNISDIGGRPHRPSRLLIARGQCRPKVRRMVKPRAIPSNLPPTAPKKPPSYSDVLSVRPNAESLASAFAQWYAKIEEEFVHLRGTEAKLGDKSCGRAEAVSYKWDFADKGVVNSQAGATQLSSAWRAVSTWCATLAKPKPESQKAIDARHTAATAALTATLDALNLNLGDDKDAVDFQSFVLQLTPQVMATQACMAHAAKAAARIAHRLEQRRMNTILTSWRASLTRGKAFTKAAFGAAKAAIGFDSSPTGVVNEDGMLAEEGCTISPSFEGRADDQIGLQPLTGEALDHALMPIVYGMRSLCKNDLDSAVDDCPASGAGITPLGLQAATEKEANKWAKLWNEGGEYVPPKFDLSRTEPPEPIHPWMLREACRSFPAETGLGIDALQPRALLRLSDDALRALCHLLMAAELHGSWPALVRTIWWC